jgi:hypothetical protein
MGLAILFLIIALVLFIVAAIGVTSRVNLVSAGLACCVLSQLSPMIG